MSRADRQDDEPICVVYTGTRSPDFEHPAVHIEHMPMLEVGAVDFEPKKVHILARQPCTLVFYSRNSVRMVAQSGVFEGVDLSSHAVWAVGEKTAASLEEHFGVAASAPEEQRFEGLVAELGDAEASRPIIAFSLQGSPRDLAGALPERDNIYEIPVYKTYPRLYPGLAATLDELEADWVAFTSPRGVGTFFSQSEGVDYEALELAAIGPTTAGALEERDLEVSLVLDTPDKELMIRRIVEFHLESATR